MSMFQKAVKTKRKLRLLITGPSGSVKTMGALILAKQFAKRYDSRIAFIDTEHGKSTLYSGNFDYDILEMAEPFTPERYIESMQAAFKAGYKVIVVDSLSHEWIGTGGLLETHANMGGKFQDWKPLTPRHRKFLDALISIDAHLICTGRSKTEYAMEATGNGKTSITKMGTKLEQRDGMEFEFDIVFKGNMQHIVEIDTDHTGIFDNFAEKLTEKTADKLIAWLDEGVEVDKKPTTTTAAPVKKLEQVVTTTTGVSNTTEVITDAPKHPTEEETVKLLVDQLIEKMKAAGDVFTPEQIEKASKIKTRTMLILGEKKYDLEMRNASEKREGAE